MAKLVQDTIDLEFLQQQCEEGCLSLETLLQVVRSIVGFIAKVQSPERDETTKEFLKKVTLMLTDSEIDVMQQEGLTAEQKSSVDRMTLIESVEFIFDSLFSFIETVKRDIINHQLEMMRAHLTRNGEGIKYQRDMFQQRIDKGEINLKRTKRFVQRMLRHEESTAEATEGIRHIHVLSLLDILFEHVLPPVTSNDQLTNVSGEEDGGGIDAIPETLDVEVDALDDMRRHVLDFVSSLSLVLKTDQYLSAGIRTTSLVAIEKDSLYTFCYDLCSEKEEERVQEMEVPVSGSSSGSSSEGGDQKKSTRSSEDNTDNDEEQRTKKVLVISRHDPHGLKGRKGRLEKSALYACDVVGKRKGEKNIMSTEKKTKMHEYFSQMEKNPTTHPVFRATATIIKNAMIRCIGMFIKNIKRNAPEMDAASMSAHMFSNGPLKPPTTACKHFNELLSELLKLSGRNFQVYEGWYGDLLKEAKKQSH